MNQEVVLFCMCMVLLLQQEADQTGPVPAQVAEEQEADNCEAIARRRGGADQTWPRRQSLQQGKTP